MATHNLISPRRIRHVILLVLTYFLLFSSCLLAQAEKRPLVVDTDMGLDDTRALALLFNLKNYKTAALVTSDGSSSSLAGAQSLSRIVHFLEVPEIPIGIGRELNAPPWREKSETLGWAMWPDTTHKEKTKISAKKTILKTLKNTKSPITYLCLGPLTNLADALQVKNFPFNKIDRVLYYGSPPNDASPTWNTRRDMQSAKMVFASPLKIWVFSPSVEQLIHFDSTLYSKISEIPSKPAQLIKITHTTNKVRKLFGSSHSMVWDEMIPIFLNAPSLVIGKFTNTSNPIFKFEHWDKVKAKREYIAILATQ